MHIASRWTSRLPAAVINGIGVALGIGLVQAVVGSLGGIGAALVASGGAVFASLADVPLAPHRTWRRVLTAALIGCATSILVTALREHTVVLGLATALIAFVSAFALAWGLRAGPISFVAVLAIVFTMAGPPLPGLAPQLAHAGWTLLGAALYIGWAIVVSWLLQPRYRSLALGSALAAAAQLMRSRAALLDPNPNSNADAGPQSRHAASPLQAWIGCEAALSDRLQVARDLLFAAPESMLARRQTRMLLLTISLRDSLLASELDLDLLSHDGHDGDVRRALGANLRDIAAALDSLRDSLRDRLGDSSRMARPLPTASAQAAPLDALASTAPVDPARARLIAALLDRARHMRDDLTQMQALAGGTDAHLPLQRSELAMFVSVEGWPLAALKPHFTWHSAVLRHALRVGVALGCAYFIAEALPWASHPAWLVLSVGVVLRGNLEQTLSRRNARVAGTAIGCGLVLALSHLGAAWLSSGVFLIAVGVAHSFIATRYLVTAAAATVMALLQAHLAHPIGGLAVNERLADTVLGAGLAWAFSYLLPSWEQRSMARIAGRITQSLAALAREALRWPEAGSSDLQLRLARREAYDALDAIAAAAQRTSVEPERVRVPLYALASLLGRSHALLAHLAAIRLLIERRADKLDRAEAEPALVAASDALMQWLSPQAAAAGDVAAAFQVDLHAAASWPSHTEGAEATAALMPWLYRRLALAEASAARVAHAADALRALAEPGP